MNLLEFRAKVPYHPQFFFFFFKKIWKKETQIYNFEYSPWHTKSLYRLYRYNIPNIWTFARTTFKIKTLGMYQNYDYFQPRNWRNVGITNDSKHRRSLASTSTHLFFIVQLRQLRIQPSEESLISYRSDFISPRNDFLLFQRNRRKGRSEFSRVDVPLVHKPRKINEESVAGVVHAEW